MYSTANLSDVELKEQGNRLFSTKKFDDAIGCYTKAIVSGQGGEHEQGDNLPIYCWSHAGFSANLNDQN